MYSKLTRLCLSLLLLISFVTTAQAARIALGGDIKEGTKEVVGKLTDATGLDLADLWASDLGANQPKDLELRGRVSMKEHGQYLLVQVEWFQAEFKGNNLPITGLSSELRTDKQGAGPGDEVDVIVGDDAGAAGQQKADKEKTDKEKADEKKKEPERNDYPMTSSRGGATISPTSSYDPSSYTSNLTVVDWESCEPRIDADAEMLYPQAKRVEKNQDGNVMSVGGCQDFGDAVKGTRTADSCPPSVSVSGGQVFATYRVYANYDGQTYDISPCKKDETATQQLSSTTDGCGLRDDYNTNRTYLQRRYFYESDAGREFVTECVDSEEFYPHFWTSETCSAVPGSVDGTIQLQQRKGYINAAGETVYLTECKSVSGGQQLVNEEVCPNQYEHDLVAGVSYAFAREYYTDQDGQKVYTSSCRPSQSITYSHHQDFAACDLTPDVPAGLVYRSYIPWISVSGTRVNVGDCTLAKEASPIAIHQTYQACDVRFDDARKSAIQQERLYYSINGTTTYLTDCQDSNLSFPYFLAKYDCGVERNDATGNFWDMKRLVIQDQAGQIQVVPGTTCQVDYSAELVRQTEACPDQFSHDFAGGVSHPFAREYYENSAGDKIYVTGCQVNAAISFPHVKNYSKCDVVYDAATSTSYPRYVTEITGSFGTKQIRDCAVDETAGKEILTSTESCPGKYEHFLAEGYSIGYSRKYYTDDTGEKHYLTNCAQDPSMKYTHVKQFEGCEATVNLAENKVYRGYKTIFVDADGSHTARDCALDTPNPIELVETTEGCGFSHDFENGVSTQQSRHFYLVDGKKTYVTTCTDSSAQYAQYETKLGCAAVVDDATGTVFEQYRKAFNDASGDTHFITDCQIKSGDNAGLTIQEEFCSPKYTHDMQLGISFGMTKKYYINDKGVKSYITSCGKSDTYAFQQLKDYDSCAASVDTRAMLVRPQFRTVINDGDEVVQVQACQPDDALSYPLQYSFEECGIRHEMAAGYSVQQEQLFYNNGTERVNVGTCQDSDIDYKHYLTSAGCAAVIDEPGGIATITKRVAFKLDNGREVLVDGETCQPDLSDTVPLKAEVCPGQFDHNLETGISLGYSRKYYIEPESNAKRYATDCAADSTMRYVQTVEEGNCDPLLDLENSTMYRRYSRFIKQDGETHYVEVCAAKMDEPIALEATADGCGYRHDFYEGESFLQKRYFVKDGAARTYVTQCLDSSQSYKHFEDETNCERLVDAATGLTFVQTRTAFRDDLEEIHYANDCRVAPGNQAGVAIQEEACPAQKYEHDFVAGQSYLRTHTYYLWEGVKHEVSACSRSSSVSFEQKLTNDGCSFVNDDANLRSIIEKRRYIDTPDDGRLYISTCDADSQVIPYAVSDTLIGNYTVNIFPKSGDEFKIKDSLIMILAGLSASSSQLAYITDTDTVELYLLNSNEVTASIRSQDGTWLDLGKSYYFPASQKIYFSIGGWNVSPVSSTAFINMIIYLRGDGTKYKKINLLKLVYFL